MFSFSTMGNAISENTIYLNGKQITLYKNEHGKYRIVNSYGYESPAEADENGNIGIGNTGKNNIGFFNTGNNNIGNYNTGNNNAGNNNSGNNNAGNKNHGDHNAGNNNKGDYNAGDNGVSKQKVNNDKMSFDTCPDYISTIEPQIPSAPDPY